MQRYKKSLFYKRAEVTLFLSLLCLTVCAFAGVLIKSSKITLIRNRIENVCNISVKSCFSEYNKYLFDNYGLLFVDTTYRGVTDGGDISFKNHLCDYSDVNLMSDNQDSSDIRLVSVSLDKTVYASDENYKPLMNQIRDYSVKKIGCPDNASIDESLNTYVLNMINSYEFMDMFYSLYEDEFRRVVYEKIIREREENLRDESEEYSDEETDEEDIVISISEIDLSEIIEELSYEKKKNVLIKVITEDLKNNGNQQFDFGNQLCVAEITFYMEGTSDKTYEYSETMSLIQ